MTTDRDVYLSATNCQTVRRIETEAGYSTISARATIECDFTTLEMGDAVSIDAGYADDHGLLFSGFVKKITWSRPDNLIRIDCNDVMVKAVDFFIAADDPENPFQRNNISSLELVKDLLELASITNVDNTEPFPTFTWGTNADGARFNLQTVADAVQFIANTTGNTIFADTSGTVYLSVRKPYVIESDTPSHAFSTGSTGTIIDITYSVSTDSTRNVVKVYGRGDLTAQASAANAYLVVDQTVVIAHELLDTADLCQGTADTNLTLLNRLTESYEITIEGDRTVEARQVATVTDEFCGASAREVFLYRVAHTIDESSGYTTNITATP